LSLQACRESQQKRYCCEASGGTSKPADEDPPSLRSSGGQAIRAPPSIFAANKRDEPLCVFHFANAPGLESTCAM
jgi:hypothetical protein